MPDTVAIIGGGIAGLATAHHLSKAGVGNIAVYEKDDEVGGKARSQYPRNGNGRLPGEHGFRFFPHFYQHLLHTLRQIEVDGSTVYDRLVEPGGAGIACAGRPVLEIERPMDTPAEFTEQMIAFLRGSRVSIADCVRYASRLLVYATSCEERRDLKYDRMSWTEFTGADRRPYSDDFEAFVIRSSRTLSAMRAEVSSAATIGDMSLQMMSLDSRGEKLDALLCSPTDEAWLLDWRRFLEARGVVFHSHAKATAFGFDKHAGKVTSVSFEDGRVVQAELYVCCVPLECVVSLLGADMRAFDPALARLEKLKGIALGDMSGVQFFLKRLVPIVGGHMQYPRTPFALTSISQGQFWTPRPESRADAAAGLKDVLSVIISDWDSPGTEGKAARDYATKDELAEEVWRQIVAELPAGTLNDSDRICSHVDNGIRLAPFGNANPLLIHPLGQRSLRPDAETAIANFFLAADYVRTNTDLATMEGADEAARRATRGVLQAMAADPAAWPAVWELREHWGFDWAKSLDHFRLRMGLPHIADATLADHAEGLEEDFRRLRMATTHVLRSSLGALRKLVPFEEAEKSKTALQSWERFLRGPGK